MASSQLVFVLQAVAELDRQLSVAIAHSDLLTAQHGSEVTSGLRRALAVSIESMHTLRERVLDCVEMGVEWNESVLRDRAAVVLMQLAEVLTELAGENPPAGRGN